MRRYFDIGLFSLALLFVLGLIETVFKTTQSGLSIYDSKGAGQVTLLATALISVILFSKFVGKSAPFGFMAPYFIYWKRSLSGFFLFLLATLIVIGAGYIGYSLQGAVSASPEGLQNFSIEVAERTIVALLVVVVLATTEELMFRVFLMRYLMWDHSKTAAVLAVISSSLVFAFLHNLNEPLSWFTVEFFPLFIGLFVLGALLCVVYISTGSLVCAIAVHVGFLGSKVFLRKTQLLTVDSEMLMLENTVDLRMSPIVWALWIGMAIVIYMLRHPLRARFGIETDLHITRANP